MAIPIDSRNVAHAAVCSGCTGYLILVLSRFLKCVTIVYGMHKRSLPRRKASKNNGTFVPFIDHRIVPDIISFRYVKGPLRLFLQVEIVLALLVVIGSCAIIILKTVVG